MSTKFILVGGYVQKAADGGRGFCAEFIDGFKEPIKILDCLFSRPFERWEETCQKDLVLFKKNLPNINFELRPASIDKFLEEIAWANCIFFRGGITDRLKKTLEDYPGWGKMLVGKTVAGTSAGADALVKYYYNVDTKVLDKGFGLVPAKYLGHYKSDYNNVDWNKAYSDLKNYREDLPILALGEGEFKVVII